MSNSTKWFLIFTVILAVLATAGLMGYFALLGGSGGFHSRSLVGGMGDRVAVIELTGEITDSRSVVRQLKKYRDNTSVRAIVLRVDSPGGAVVPSQEMYEEVRKTRDAGLPVVVSMGSLAASGGYYVALGGSVLVANRGTLTGSIGVISQILQLSEALDNLGIDFKTIKSGEMKDVGDFSRPMSEKEEKYLEGLMAAVHEQFRQVVGEERGLEGPDLLAVSDGRVFTGEEALELGLVDTIGTYEDAIQIAADLGGIEDEPTIVRERPRRSFLDPVFEDVTERFRGIREETLNRPVLQYKYPGAK